MFNALIPTFPPVKLNGREAHPSDHKQSFWEPKIELIPNLMPQNHSAPHFKLKTDINIRTYTCGTKIGDKISYDKHKSKTF